MSGFGSTSYGVASYGTSGGSPPSLVTLSSGLSIAALVSASDIREALAEGLTLGDVLAGYDLPNLLDSIALTGSAATYFTARNALTDGLSFEDSLQVAWQLLLQEDLQLVGTAVGNPRLLGAIVDTLHAIGAAETRLDAVAAVSAALALEGLIANGWSVQSIDSVAFNEALDATARFVGPLVDSAALADGAEHALRILALARDELTAADTLAGALSMQAEASDGILLYATIRLGGTEYAGWVLNTANKAASEYTNFAFDSFAVFNGKVLGAGAGGIFELTGGTDDGDPIAAAIRTGLSDFGIGKLKRVPDVYIGYAGNGDIVLKVVTTADNGVKVEDWYRMTAKPGDAMHPGRIQVGRGLKSRYWQFELCNTGGADLDLGDLKLRPLILDRRI